MKAWSRWQDWLSVVVGKRLFISPSEPQRSAGGSGSLIAQPWALVEPSAGVGTGVALPLALGTPIGGSICLIAWTALAIIVIFTLWALRQQGYADAESPQLAAAVVPVWRANRGVRRGETER